MLPSCQNFFTFFSGYGLVGAFLQDGTPPDQLRVEAALSLRAAGQAPAAPPTGRVAVQLMRGRAGQTLGAEEHVVEEAIVAASVDGPGTYGLWCAA